MKNIYAGLALACILASSAQAKTYSEMFGQEPPYEGDAVRLLNSLDFKQGHIDLPDVPASLEVPDQLYYLNVKDATTLLTEIWGNPPSVAEGVSGMLMPAKYPPEADIGWGTVISYEADGYVSDEDAEDIDYGELLASLKTAISENNPEREKAGYEPMELIGWASPPHYEKQEHALHWAKDLLFGKGEDSRHTLNYAVRVLGREGVLQMNFVAGLDQLDEIKTNIPSFLKVTNFDQGKKYTDFMEGDKVAGYGLAGLIAAGAGAKLAAKAGIFAIALAFLKKGFVIVLVAAAGAWRFVKRLFGKNDEPTS